MHLLRIDKTKSKCVTTNVTLQVHAHISHKKRLNNIKPLEEKASQLSSRGSTSSVTKLITYNQIPNVQNQHSRNKYTEYLQLKPKLVMVKEKRKCRLFVQNGRGKPNSVETTILRHFPSHLFFNASNSQTKL